MVRKIKKKVLIPIIILVILAAGAGGFYKALTWGADMKRPKTSSFTTIAEKIGQAPKKGGEIDLSSEDLNSIIQSVMKKGITKGGVTVKDAYVDIPDDKLVLYTPINYKGRDLLLTTTGKVTYKNNKIIYSDLSFKVGKITIPKKYVMGKLKSLSKGNLKVTDDSIEVSTASLPIEIKSVGVKDKKMPIVIKDTTLSKLSENKGGQKTSTNTKTNNKTTGKTAVSKRTATLQRAIGQLSSAAGACSTSGERAVIYAAQGELRKMISNPSYRPGGGAAKAAYGKLSAKERSEVKAAIFSHVDTGALMEVMNTMQ